MTAVADAVVSDASLVVAAQAGDRDAFRQLFDRHAHRVAGICHQRLRNNNDVDDAIQESFVRALTKIDQLREPERFGAWVRSIAVRVCVDHHRAARRMVPVDAHDQSELHDEGPLPDELFETQERGAAARGSLRQIGERDRRALWMRHVDEAPIATVAAHLGMTEGSTRVMLARARQRLRAVTTTLPAFLPLSWRQWLREHLPAATPALEALAVAVAVGIMAAAAPQADAAAPQPRDHVELDSRHLEQVAERKGERTGGDRGKNRRTRDRVEGAQEPSAGGAPDTGSATSPRERPLNRVRNSVKVSNDYPDPEETDELVDLTLFGAAEEATVRFYGDEVGPAGEAAVETAEDLLTPDAPEQPHNGDLLSP